jgi:hypothetical protein
MGAKNFVIFVFPFISTAPLLAGTSGVRREEHKVENCVLQVIMREMTGKAG